jgi:hypothetical protein
MSSTAANGLREILGLETEPVAVFLLPSGPASPAFDCFATDKAEAAHRYRRGGGAPVLDLHADVEEPAKQAGATDAEIAEAILVSRLMKMATVSHTAAGAGR